MPSIATIPTRRRRSETEDASGSTVQGDGTSDSDDLASNGSNKRSRFNHQSPDVEDSPTLSPPTTQRRVNNADTTPVESRIVAQRDSGVSLLDGETDNIAIQEHQPGSIVRVTMENFVTYTSASFHPGPALNMVIGPNGTGKSTLVCAICLGLGWGPQHLGRAKELNEFVKHGCSEAMIEIELKGRPGKRNSVIKRVIKREGNKTQWWLDGQTSNLKNVRAVAEKYSIQIDNLCQFLPQDRVVEFSAMTPRELLSSTQRAAADPEMVEWHEELKRLRADQKSAEAEQTTSKKELDNLENRQRQQQADVDRMQEREEALKKIETLERLKPYAHLWTNRHHYNTVREQHKEKDKKLRELSKQDEPNRRRISSKQAYNSNINNSLKQRKLLFEKQEKYIEKLKRDMLQQGKREEGVDRSISTAKAQTPKFKSDMSAIKLEINRIRAAMQNEPEEFDPVAYNEQMREIQRKANNFQTQINEIETRNDERSQAIVDKTRTIDQYENNLKNMASQAGKQEAKLGNFSQNSLKAWLWLKQNRNMFEEHVYGPPIIECSVKDPRFADQVEAALQRNNFMAFTCTNPRDFKKLQAQLHGTMRLTDIATRVSAQPLTNYRPPVDGEEMKRLGFEGWVLDLLEGPEPVLEVLCEDAKVHSTAYMSQDGGTDHYRLVERSNVSSWVSPKSHHTITRRREYGPNAVSTRVRNVMTARFWNNKAIDTGQEHGLKEQMNGLKTEVDGLKEEMSEARKLMKEHIRRKAELEDEKRKVGEEKSEKQKARIEFDYLPNRLEMKQDELRNKEKQFYEHLDDIKRQWDEKTEIELKQCQLAIDLSNNVNSLKELHKNLLIARIAQIEAESDVTILKQRHDQVSTELEETREEVERLKTERERLREVVRKNSTELKEIVTAHPEVKDYFESLTEQDQNRTPQELEVDIDSLQTRVGLLHAGNPQIIKDYEARKEKIASLKSRLQDQEDTLSSLSQSINQVRARWEPALDELIAKISAAFSACFEKINCAGEVKIHKDGDGGRDFDAWAVQIHVKFREREAMSLLDSHRQSGGERAVSTIFYLMALQSLSRAPFRVVDEINQGMDPRNERMVHERMVDIACGRSSDGASEGPGSQYFLITPKLLANLKYSPGMKVHCIASGERMPRDPAQLDFGKLVKRAKELKLGRRAGVAAV